MLSYHWGDTRTGALSQPRSDGMRDMRFVAVMVGVNCFLYYRLRSESSSRSMVDIAGALAVVVVVPATMALPNCWVKPNGMAAREREKALMLRIRNSDVRGGTQPVMNAGLFVQRQHAIDNMLRISQKRIKDEVAEWDPWFVDTMNRAAATARDTAKLGRRLQFMQQLCPTDTSLQLPVDKNARVQTKKTLRSTRDQLFKRYVSLPSQRFSTAIKRVPGSRSRCNSAQVKAAAAEICVARLENQSTRMAEWTAVDNRDKAQAEAAKATDKLASVESARDGLRQRASKITCSQAQKNAKRKAALRDQAKRVEEVKETETKAGNTEAATTYHEKKLEKFREGAGERRAKIKAEHEPLERRAEQIWAAAGRRRQKPVVELEDRSRTLTALLGECAESTEKAERSMEKTTRKLQNQANRYKDQIKKEEQGRAVAKSQFQKKLQEQAQNRRENRGRSRNDVGSDAGGLTQSARRNGPLATATSTQPRRLSPVFHNQRTLNDGARWGQTNRVMTGAASTPAGLHPLDARPGVEYRILHNDGARTAFTNGGMTAATSMAAGAQPSRAPGEDSMPNTVDTRSSQTNGETTGTAAMTGTNTPPWRPPPGLEDRVTFNDGAGRGLTNGGITTATSFVALSRPRRAPEYCVSNTGSTRRGQTNGGVTKTGYMAASSTQPLCTPPGLENAVVTEWGDAHRGDQRNEQTSRGEISTEGNGGRELEENFWGNETAGGGENTRTKAEEAEETFAEGGEDELRSLLERCDCLHHLALFRRLNIDLRSVENSKNGELPGGLEDKLREDHGLHRVRTDQTRVVATTSDTFFGTNDSECERVFLG